MAGIKANSDSVTMLDGDTAVDKEKGGFVDDELVTLTTFPTGTVYTWVLSKPDGATARADLSASSGASVTFRPDVAGVYYIAATVDGTGYQLRATVVAVANVNATQTIRFSQTSDASIPTPLNGGITLYNADDYDGLSYKKDDGTVVNLPDADTGEANTASNIGSGADIFSAKAGVDLEFRGVEGTNGIVDSVNGDNVEVSGAALLPLDGSRAMTSDLDMGAQDITNVGLVDGQNVSILSSPLIAARKKTAGTITKGSPVYNAGWNIAGYMDVEEADATTAITYPSIGLANEDITASATGYIRIACVLEDTDTSLWNERDPLYLDTTPGQLVNVRPTGLGIAIQRLGEVARKHALNGTINVHVGCIEDVNQMLAATRVWESDAQGTPQEVNPANRWAPAAHAASHEIGGSDLLAHQSITGSGTNTHAQIDTHIGATTNPHATDIGNLGSGTIAELNTAVTDATLIPDTRTLTAGAGLTGGGDLSANRTFNVVANVDGSIVVNADDVRVGILATDAQHGARGGGTQHAVATTSVNGFMSATDKVSLDSVAGILARKASVGTIAKGAPVYAVAWSVSGWLTVEEADADNPSTMPAIGLAAEALTNAATGNVVTSGVLADWDTSSWSVGDPLYVDTTAGQLVNVKPTGTTTGIQKVGEVVRSNVSNGSVLVIGAGRTNDLPQMSVASRIWLSDVAGTPQETDGDTLWLSLAGGTMAADIAMGGNSVTGAAVVSGAAAADLALNAVTGQSVLTTINSVTELEVNATTIDAKSNDIATTGTIQLGAIPASAGDIRLSNDTGIFCRNAANSADVRVAHVLSDNGMMIGDGSAYINMYVGATPILSLASTSVNAGGASFVTTATFVGGTNSSTVGTYRCANTTQGFSFRNAANTGNIFALGISGTDELYFGETVGANGTYFFTKTGTTHQLQVAGTTELSVSGTVVDAQSNTVRSTGPAEFGSTPATAGTYRGPNTTTALSLRNNANSANVTAIGISTSDEIEVGLAATVKLGNVDMNGNDILDVGVSTSSAETVATSSSGAITVTWAASNLAITTLTENITSITLTPPASGKARLTWTITQAAGASYTVSGWPATVKWAGGPAPTMTATNSAWDKYTFEWNGTNYSGTYAQAFGP